MTAKSDLYSLTPDGTRTDEWVLDELLGDDDLDEGEYRHVIPARTELSYRAKLRCLMQDETKPTP